MKPLLFSLILTFAFSASATDLKDENTTPKNKVMDRVDSDDSNDVNLQDTTMLVSGTGMLALGTALITTDNPSGYAMMIGGGLIALPNGVRLCHKIFNKLSSKSDKFHKK